MYSDNEILNRQKILLNIRENTDVTGTFEFCQSLQSWNARLELSMGDSTLEERWEMYGQTIESHVCHFFCVKTRLVLQLNLFYFFFWCENSFWLKSKV